MNFYDYIKPEFLVLIPVLWFIGWIIKKSNIKNCIIPFVLVALSTALCLIYLLATTDLDGFKCILMCIFLSFTQGVIAAACAVFGNQLIKQTNEIINSAKANNENIVQK